MFSFVTLNASEVILLLLCLGLICLIWVTVKTSGKRKAQLKKLLEETEGELDGSPFDFSNATYKNVDLTGVELKSSKLQGELRDVDLTQAGVRHGGFFAEHSDSSDSSDSGDSGGD